MMGGGIPRPPKAARRGVGHGVQGEIPGETFPGSRGFALLIVLWTMGLLALLVTQFTSAARTELRITMNLHASAVAQSAADGAVHAVIPQLLRGAWLPDARPRVVRIGNAAVTVLVKNLATKINPNVVQAPVLRMLLVRLGVDSGRAAALAQAIVDWRTPSLVSLSGQPKYAPYDQARLPYRPSNQPFDTLEELGLVVGMTPDVLMRMRPFLSLYQEGDEADETVDPVMAAADDAPLVNGTGWQLGATGRVMVVSIEATATAPGTTPGTSAGGGRFTRRATVRLRSEPTLEQAVYEILTWDTLSR